MVMAFGVETIDGSCGVCFDGPAAFTGGQQFKQLMGGWNESSRML